MGYGGGGDTLVHLECSESQHPRPHRKTTKNPSTKSYLSQNKVGLVAVVCLFLFLITALLG